MTLFRYLCGVAGALAILGALVPAARVSPGRFSQAPTRRFHRTERVAMLGFGLACVALAATCGRT